MECRICRSQYIGKPETEFNIRLNNHRNDVNRQNAPQAEKTLKTLHPYGLNVELNFPNQ